MKKLFKCLAVAALYIAGASISLAALTCIIWAFKEMYLLPSTNHTLFWLWLIFIVCALIVVIADIFDVFDTHKY